MPRKICGEAPPGAQAAPFASAVPEGQLDAGKQRRGRRSSHGPGARCRATLLKVGWRAEVRVPDLAGKPAPGTGAIVYTGTPDVRVEPSAKGTGLERCQQAAAADESPPSITAEVEAPDADSTSCRYSLSGQGAPCELMPSHHTSAHLTKSVRQRRTALSNWGLQAGSPVLQRRVMQFACLPLGPTGRLAAMLALLLLLSLLGRASPASAKGEKDGLWPMPRLPAGAKCSRVAGIAAGATRTRAAAARCLSILRAAAAAVLS